MRRWQAMCLVLSALGSAGEAAAIFEDAARAKAFIAKFVSTSGPPKAHIEALIEKLGHDEYAVRERATEKLCSLGEAAVPFVERAAKSDDPEVRFRAQSILRSGQKQPDDASADLAKAIDAVAAAKDKALIPLLLRLLDSPRVDVRYAAEYGLRRAARQCFGYNAYADADTRARPVAQWRQWWKTAAPTFAFGPKPRVRAMPAGILVGHERVLQVSVVNLKGDVVMTRGVAAPAYVALALSNGNLLYAHLDGSAVAETSREGRELWRWEGLKPRPRPISVERLANGNTLLALFNERQVVEVRRDGRVVWAYSRGGQPASARCLASGNTLIALWGATGKVVEVTRAGKVVWEHGPLRCPYDAVELSNGNVLIAEGGGGRVLEVHRSGKVVWETREVGHPTSAHRLSEGTTVIGDYERGVLLVGRDGRLLRNLSHERVRGKITLVPRAWLKRRGK